MCAISEGGVFKRLDLAINDKAGILDIPELTEKCRNEECISVFRSFKSYRSGELIHREEKEAMGNTLYIGSLKSEIYFCIYEKDYEQYVKNGVPIEESEVKNRFEIRLKNDRAYHAIIDLLSYRDAERTAFSIINRYLRFVDKVENKRRSEWKTNENWAWFLSNAQSLVLMAIVVIGLYLGFKREFSKLIGFLIIALIAVGLVFNASGVKDVLLNLFNRVVGA